MEIVLREAEPEDTDRINELYIEMLNSIYSVKDSRGYENGYPDRFLPGGDERAFVAEDEYGIAAFLSVEVYRDEDYVYLDDFSVTVKYRSHGIGSKLIAVAEDYTKKNSISNVMLHVEKNNYGAYCFYLRHGYTVHSDENHRILMNKNIS